MRLLNCVFARVMGPVQLCHVQRISLWSWGYSSSCQGELRSGTPLFIYCCSGYIHQLHHCFTLLVMSQLPLHIRLLHFSFPLLINVYLLLQLSAGLPLTTQACYKGFCNSLALTVECNPDNQYGKIIKSTLRMSIPGPTSLECFSMLKKAKFI